jgi:hypothetical protein
MRRRSLWVVLSILVFAFLAMGADSCEEESGSSGDSAEEKPKEDKADSGDEKKAEPKKDDCGSEASDDCTPHVGANGSVRVDALVWKVKSAQQAASLGDQQYGLGEKADGVFVVVNLSVTSKKNESATLTDEAVQLEVAGGNTYKADSDGTIAAIGSGQEPKPTG